MAQEHITLEELVELISASAGVRTDTGTAATQSFEELGVDSLGVLGIVAEIERRVGRKLGSEAELSPSPTALIAFVNEDAPTLVEGV
ncbi:acyl carrier protein [Nocardiopsis sp. NPDC058789]|uniref:Acyl carrier protein n=1 Tax=Nocardiopsis eucommiae TaxID=2831970 RepID=A0A975QKK4_9ACTN|nr:acyl carrier protein [Nocardiopsis eucommiae]